MPTWESVEIAAGNGGRFESLDPTHWGYWGVEIHPDYVEAVAAVEGRPIIDRSIAEERSGEAMGYDLSDPRTFWAFLTKPYDSRRRQP